MDKLIYKDQKKIPKLCLILLVLILIKTTFVHKKNAIPSKIKIKSIFYNKFKIYLTIIS